MPAPQARPCSPPWAGKALGPGPGRGQGAWGCEGLTHSHSRRVARFGFEPTTADLQASSPLGFDRTSQCLHAGRGRNHTGASEPGSPWEDWLALPRVVGAAQAQRTHGQALPAAEGHRAASVKWVWSPAHPWVSGGKKHQVCPAPLSGWPRRCTVTTERHPRAAEARTRVSRSAPRRPSPVLVVPAREATWTHVTLIQGAPRTAPPLFGQST